MDYSEDASREAMCLSTQYSLIRSGFSKWRSFKYKADLKPESDISLQEISDGKYFMLYSKDKKVVQGVLYSNIVKRISLKKNKKYFLAVKKLLGKCQSPTENCRTAELI